MKHVVLLYVAITFGAFSYCLSLLVSKDAPAVLVLVGGFTGIAILAGVSWLVWSSGEEQNQIEGHFACASCSTTITGGEAAGPGCGSDEIKEQRI